MKPWKQPSAILCIQNTYSAKLDKYSKKTQSANFYLDDEEHFEVGESCGDAAEDGAHLGGEEFC